LFGWLSFEWGFYMKKYLVAAMAAICLPGVAAAQDDVAPKMDGVRLEARLGYETPTVSDSSGVYKIGSAVSYGGEIGFDLKAGKSVVVGPYAVYEFSGVDLCDGAGNCLGENGNFAAGGRLGFILGDKTQLYVKAGYASIDMKATSGGASGSQSKSGVQGAIGVDYNFSKHVYGMVEANYADYGDFYGIKLQRRHVAAGIGVRF